MSWLPAGAALWRSYGGPLAQTSESDWMAGVEFRLRELAWLQSKDASSGRNRPKPPNPPKYAHQIATEGDETLRKADAYRARQKRL